MKKIYIISSKDDEITDAGSYETFELALAATYEGNFIFECKCLGEIKTTREFVSNKKQKSSITKTKSGKTAKGP